MALYTNELIIYDLKKQFLGIALSEYKDCS